MGKKSIWNDYNDFSITACDRVWECNVHVVGTHYYAPGRMYMPNGDPGYPPEEDFEITELDVTDITDEEGNSPTDAQKDEITEKIEDWIYSDADYGMWNGWEADCDDC